MLGGGMRQVGVLAAPALVALDHVPRLADDHRRARVLAEGLAALPGVTLVYGPPASNIVFARFSDAAAIQARLADRGVHAIATGPDVMRFVTHYDVGDDAVQAALAAVAESI